MSEELPVLQLLKKPTVTVNLDKVQSQLKAILEQTRSATAFPVALLDSQRLESIILETTKAYGTALSETLRMFEQARTGNTEKLQGLTVALEQTNTQFTHIISLLGKIDGFITKQNKNAELEKKVLEKLNRMLI